MRTKVIAALLAILTALGGLNLFQSIRDRLLPPVKAESTSYRTEAVAPKAERVSIGVSERSGGEVVIDETYDVKRGDELFIDIMHADLNVDTSAKGEARVVVTVSGRNMKRAMEKFEEMNFRASHKSGQVRLIAESKNRNWSFRNNGDLSIQVDVFIPDEFDLDVSTSHGDVTLDDLNGDIRLATSHGRVLAQTISGRSISLTSSHGRIRATEMAGDDVSVQTSHANIVIGRVESEDFTAKTSHSNVEIDELVGNTEIQTSHGNIDISVNSNLQAELETSHGNITVSAPADFAADLDLQGGRIRMASAFDFDGTIKKERARGQLNGGGATIDARTSHGSITFKTR